jgi:hypothetical protein
MFENGALNRYHDRQIGLVGAGEKKYGNLEAAGERKEMGRRRQSMANG